MLHLYLLAILIYICVQLAGLLSAFSNPAAYLCARNRCLRVAKLSIQQVGVQTHQHHQRICITWEYVTDFAPYHAPHAGMLTRAMNSIMHMPLA
jgi:hypothetical protein